MERLNVKRGDLKDTERERWRRGICVLVIWRRSAFASVLLTLSTLVSLRRSEWQQCEAVNEIHSFGRAGEREALDVSFASFRL